MRVSTLAIIVVLLIAPVGAGLWFFGGIDGFFQWQAGFTPATTPEQAMEKFRAAIQQRKYRWAANYCTKDYADVLGKSDACAARLGDIIDKIRAYMENNKLPTDQSVLLLHYLDPFPANFRVQGAVKQITDREAMGVFLWEPPLLNGSGGTLTAANASSIDIKMFQRNMTPANLFAVNGVKIVKEGDHWKLNLETSPAVLESVRYFLDHCPAHESELKTFRTYMLNGRYDSPKAFEGEVLDSLKKASSGAR